MTYRESLVRQIRIKLLNQVKGEHNIRLDRESSIANRSYHKHDDFPDLIGNSDKK